MNQRGFTLLEVLVATVIMGIAVVTLLSGVSGSLNSAARVVEYDRAVLLARTKMDQLLADRTLPMNQPMGGEIPPVLLGGAHGGWSAQVTPGERGPHPGPGQYGLERLQLKVWWESGSHQRSFDLEAYRAKLMQPGDLVSPGGGQ